MSSPAQTNESKANPLRDKIWLKSAQWKPISHHPGVLLFLKEGHGGEKTTHGCSDDALNIPTGTKEKSLKRYMYKNIFLKYRNI